jgi:hypothetical protein
MFVSLRIRRSIYLNLEDLATHNLIEHDASLAHDDAVPGNVKAPVAVNPELLQDFLSRAAPNHGLTLSDFAYARVDRETRLSKPLDGLHAQIGQGEGALSWLLLRDDINGEVNTERLHEWWGEERLVDGWWTDRKRKATVGLGEARAQAEKISNMMTEIRGRGD